MESGIFNDKIKGHLEKGEKPNVISDRKRKQSAIFSKLLKNKLFKGYQKIKFLRNKNFNMDKFIRTNPGEKYLPTDEKYNIYYEYKFLNKYKCMTDRELSLRNNISVQTNKANICKKKVVNLKNQSTMNFFLTENDKKVQKNRSLKIFDIKKIKENININENKKIWNDNDESFLYSRYPFIYLNRIPDEIVNPKDMRNYPHYIQKYKDKNRNQQSFLYSLSHNKEKKEKNIYRHLTPKKNYYKLKIKKKIDTKEIEKCLSVSSPVKNEENSFFNNLYIIIDNPKIKRILGKNGNEKLVKGSIFNIN